MKKTFALIMVIAFLIVGCRTIAVTKYSDSTWVYDPTKEEWYENKFVITAKTKAGMFGDVPQAVHDVSSKWTSNSGDPQDVVQFGQQSTLSNAGQIEALAIGGNLTVDGFKAIAPFAYQVLAAQMNPKKSGPVKLPPGMTPQHIQAAMAIIKALPQGTTINEIATAINKLRDSNSIQVQPVPDSPIPVEPLQPDGGN